LTYISYSPHDDLFLTIPLFSFFLSFSFFFLQIVKPAVTVSKYQDGSRKRKIDCCPSVIHHSVSKLFTDNTGRLERTEGHRLPSCIVVCCSAIMDCLVVPLQEKLEDWKKSVVNLDKDHAKGKT
jgi:hypothetical protein